MGVLRENYKKIPWYAFAPIPVFLVMLEFLHDWLTALGLSPPILVFVYFAALLAALLLPFHAGKWLSHRFRALESDREDIDIFGRPS